MYGDIVGHNMKHETGLATEGASTCARKRALPLHVNEWPNNFTHKDTCFVPEWITRFKQIDWL